MWKLALLFVSGMSFSVAASISPTGDSVSLSDHQNPVQNDEETGMEPRHLHFLHHLAHHHWLHKHPYHHGIISNPVSKGEVSISSAHAESSGVSTFPNKDTVTDHDSGEHSHLQFDAPFGVLVSGHGTHDEPHGVDHEPLAPDVLPQFSDEPHHHWVSDGIQLSGATSSSSSSSANSVSVGGEAAAASSEAASASKSLSGGHLGSSSSISFSQTHSLGGKGSSATFSLSKAFNIG